MAAAAAAGGAGAGKRSSKMTYSERESRVLLLLCVCVGLFSLLPPLGMGSRIESRFSFCNKGDDTCTQSHIYTESRVGRESWLLKRVLSDVIYKAFDVDSAGTSERKELTVCVCRAVFHSLTVGSRMHWMQYTLLCISCNMCGAHASYQPASCSSLLLLFPSLYTCCCRLETGFPLPCSSTGEIMHLQDIVFL